MTPYRYRLILMGYSHFTTRSAALAPNSSPVQIGCQATGKLRRALPGVPVRQPFAAYFDNSVNEPAVRSPGLSLPAEDALEKRRESRH